MKFKIDASLMERAVELWGEDAQLFMVAEETAELIQAISKWRRYREEKYRRWILEELADVLIMLKQLMVMFDMDDKEVNAILKIKMKKMKGRMDKHDMD